MINFRVPRLLKPELIQVGDIITVELPEDGGIRVTKKGEVAAREDHGDIRFIRTKEGATLLTWQPNNPEKGVTVWLHSRVEVKDQDALFEVEFLTDMKARAS